MGYWAEMLKFLYGKRGNGGYETWIHKPLWYRSPATDFDHALPVGNGRIGGMLFGDPEHEVIKLNEDSVWSGGKRERNNPDAYEGLLEIRKLLAEEHIQAAEKIAFEKCRA